MAQSKRIKIDSKVEDKAKCIIEKSLEAYLTEGRLSDPDLFPLIVYCFFQLFKKGRIELLVDDSASGPITISVEEWAAACRARDVMEMTRILCQAVLTVEDFSEGAEPPLRKQLAIYVALRWLKNMGRGPWNSPKFTSGFESIPELWESVQHLKKEVGSVIGSFRPVEIKPEIVDGTGDEVLRRCCETALELAMHPVTGLGCEDISTSVEYFFRALFGKKRVFFPGGISIDDDEYHGICLSPHVKEMVAQVKAFCLGHLGLYSKTPCCSALELIALQIVGRMRRAPSKGSDLPTHLEVMELEEMLSSSSGATTPAPPPPENTEASSGYSSEALSSTNTPGSSRATPSSVNNESSEPLEAPGTTSEEAEAQVEVLTTFEDPPGQGTFYTGYDRGDYYLIIPEYPMEKPRVHVKEYTKMMAIVREKHNSGENGDVDAGKYMLRLLYTPAELTKRNWIGRPAAKNKIAFKGDPRTDYIIWHLELLKQEQEHGEDFHARGIPHEAFTKIELEHIKQKVFIEKGST